MNIKLSDFKIGQIVYVELCGNASRYKKGDELIEEWEIINIGRKYITANKNGYYSREENFMEHNIPSYLGGLVQKTNYSIDYVLYPTKETIEDNIKRKELIVELSNGKFNSLSLDQLRRIKDIINEGDK